MSDQVTPLEFLRRKFELAVEYSGSADAKAAGGLDTATQLAFYGLFKQATQGPPPGKAPSQLNFVKYSKWKAWDDVKTLSSQDAMKKYLAEMDKAQPDWKEAVKKAQQIKFRSKL